MRIDYRIRAELTKATEMILRYRTALENIVGCHGEDECGVCGSLRIAKEALAPIAGKDGK